MGIRHYCTGKSKMMCQVARNLKRLYLRSLKTGNKNMLLAFLRNFRAKYCAANASTTRCKMTDIFWKYLGAATLRTGKSRPVTVVPKTKPTAPKPTPHIKTPPIAPGKHVTGDNIAQYNVLIKANCRKGGDKAACALYKRLAARHSGEANRNQQTKNMLRGKNLQGKMESAQEVLDLLKPAEGI